MQRFMRSEFWRFAVTAAAAVLVIAALSYYQFLVRVDTSVFFDVNPSFTLSVNRLNRVVFVDSDNDDAKAILAGADLMGKELEDAVETLFDVMKEQGYFDEEEKTVLVSVDCNSRERLAKITEDLTEEINEYLTQNTGGGSVFGQTVHVDEETREFARSHKISPGKVQNRKAADGTPAESECIGVRKRSGDNTLFVYKSLNGTHSVAQTGSQFKAVFFSSCLHPVSDFLNQIITAALQNQCCLPAACAVIFSTRIP